MGISRKAGRKEGQHVTILHSTSHDGQIHTITLNRPKKLNAISFETMNEVHRCIEDDINPYSSLARVVIFKAVGKHFTSGIDIKSAALIGKGIKNMETSTAAVKIIYDLTPEL